MQSFFLNIGQFNKIFKLAFSYILDLEVKDEPVPVASPIVSPKVNFSICKKYKTYRQLRKNI